MTREFVHLHVHSEYSLLDGACRIKPMLEKVQHCGMKAVAITDHGNLFGAVEFYLAAREYGIKPIIGAELYIAPKGRFDKNATEKTAARHILLIATNVEGYVNLARLSSIGYTEGFYYKPRIDYEVLEKYNKGLLCATSCLKGEVPELILTGKLKEADRAVGRYKDIFGKERFFLELHDHGINDQKIVNREMLTLAKRHDLKIIVANDAHYVNQDDAAVQDALLCIQTGKTLGETDRLKFASDEFYLKSPDEMEKVFPDLDDAFKNTLDIAEMCHVEIPLEQRLLPKFHPPDGKSVKQYIEELVEDGLATRYGTPSQALRDRTVMELDVIHTMGFNSYFLITWDFIHFAKEHGIPVGPGRGSAAGSIVAYALGITDIDPIEHGLIFERFLNRERVSMPDIDVDFCFERRGEVIEYVKEKYGRDKVAHIITFGTMKAKNAIRDVGRVLGLPLAMVDRTAKLIPDFATLEKALEVSPDLKELYTQDGQIKRLVDLAMRLEGMVRHASIHAAGIVIAEESLTNHVPLYKSATEPEIATQFTMGLVEKIGLLKMDFLGLKNLTVIDKTIKRIQRIHGLDIDWPKIGLADEKTYRLLQQGDTFGVFQMESSGMRDIVKRLAPRTFADITALLSLYRPGPLGSGMVEDFISRKHGRKDIVYDLPELKPILEETYGIILYQEQVIKIANVIGAFTLGEADLLRRAMGKKKPEVMAEQKSKFIEGALKNTFPDMVAEKLFDQIEKFAGYGFNKSHSAAYAVITYRTAFLKANYPVEYMASLMSSEIGKTDRLPLYFRACKDMGIKVLPPDVNESDDEFTPIEHSVRFGLAGIKNVGVNAVRSIVEERREEGAFENFGDFCLRVDLNAVNSRMIEALIRAGAFDSFGLSRPQLLEMYPEIVEMASAWQREKQSDQISLFEMLEETEVQPGIMTNIKVPNIPEWSEREKLQSEKELLGFYVSGHPLDKFWIDSLSFATTLTTQIGELKPDAEVQLIGLINKITTKVDRQGRPYAFVQIEDYEGQTEMIVFSSVFEKCKNCLEVDTVVSVKARVNRRNEENNLLVLELTPAEGLRKKLGKFVEVTLQPAEVTDNNLEALKNTLLRHKGKRKVRICLEKPDVPPMAVEVGKGLEVEISDELLDELQELPFQKVLTLSAE